MKKKSGICSLIMANVLNFPKFRLSVLTGTHKMIVRKVNWEDFDQTASSLPCLSRLLWKATTVRNFRTFTVPADGKNSWIIKCKTLYTPFNIFQHLSNP